MLKFQEHIADATVNAAKEAFKYAKAVPADKLDWKPAEATRSVLDQCRELAQTPVWAIAIIENQPMPTEEDMAKSMEVTRSWTTVEQCEEKCLENLKPLLEIFKNMPDERLNDTKWLPFDGGRDFTMVEIMEYPRWNFNYHLGQIAFIQLMYGDKDMH